MDIADALRVLGLSDAPDWSDVRAAHRRAIVRTHPDAGGSAGDAARVNQAFDLLRKISGNGERPIPGGAPAPPTAPVPGSRSTSPEQLIADDDPVELLLRMADAAHEIGEVVFVDPGAGLLEVIVGVEPAVGQLTATLDDSVDEGTPIVFTLEALGSAPAPPIETVVADLLRRFRYETRDPD